MIKETNLMNLSQLSGIRTVVLEEFIALAKKYEIDQLFLYGSRARGVFKKTSDIDLGVVGKKAFEFWLDADEDTSTLLRIDFVNVLEEKDKDFLDHIKKEGILFYEKI